MAVSKKRTNWYFFTYKEPDISKEKQSHTKKETNENTSLKNKKKDFSRSEKKVTIPDDDNRCFSFKKLWAFAGPGFLMSIAYLDPGNIESDLRSGSITRYALLWVVLLASVMGLFIQRLAARLGTVTGLHLAEMCYKQYRKVPRVFLWVMVEIAIVTSDIQEVIGAAIAMYLLSNERIPLWAGVIITVCDTLTILCIDKFGLRKLELVFAFFITIMGITFGYQYIISEPDHLALIKGMFLPICGDCDYYAFLQVMGIIGAVIMPHNLYLHSALVISRDIDRNKVDKVREANMYFIIEASVAVFFTFLINVFVVAVFANGLHGTTNNQLIDRCQGTYSNITNIPNNDEVMEANLYTGGIFLACTYGLASKYIWGIGILASGQSSTLTGTYAGQFAMEGFLNLQWERWIKVLVTRSLAITPTFCVAFFTRIEELTYMNDIMNIINCVQLPFATIPIITFTSSRQIMGEHFVNNWFVKTVAISLCVLVIGMNTYFIIKTLDLLDPHGIVWATVGIVGTAYFVICIYLAIHMVVTVSERDFTDYKFIKKYVLSSSTGYSSL